MELHWDDSVPRRGLGDLIHKANHIALTVSDIGRSLGFYTDILGLQQIKRPNFDRHGAWLTMGNIELFELETHSGSACSSIWQRFDRQSYFIGKQQHRAGAGEIGKYGSAI
uniref:Glyoxalase/fosfomycin resistance/dioxygenase domain-containing protein n=1 Tax=Clytia hemisphaerica TaxID=252671 RepID=A0A7M5XG79_9CNID